MTLLPMLAAAALAGAPSPSPLAAAFGATVVSTYPDGRTALLWLKPDGTYDARGRRRLPSSGRWTVKAGKVCLKQLAPKRAPFTVCTPFPKAAGIGTAWRAKAVTGEAIKVTLRAGR